MILDVHTHLVIDLVIRQIAEAKWRRSMTFTIRPRQAAGQWYRLNLDRFDNVLNRQNRDAEDLVIDS
tara:strand:- start:321 stop:521 length:201 start_codon:yes stop_codon:yes gene_type:complete